MRRRKAIKTLLGGRIWTIKPLYLSYRTALPTGWKGQTNFESIDRGHFTCKSEDFQLRDSNRIYF